MNHQRISQLLLLCASFVLASSAQSEDSAPSTTPTPLTLIHGWYNAPFGTSDAEVETIDGIMHFKGAVATSGSDAVMSVLPNAFHPKHGGFIPIDLCDAHYGALEISSLGVELLSVRTPTEAAYSYAQCFTSLDGASIALSGTGFTALALINGWTTGAYSDSPAEVANIDGIVHFKGAIATFGSNAEAFVLPKKFRPAHYVYIPVDLCGGADKGRLIIEPNGAVSVEAETSWSDAQCDTSLDGAWFALGGTGFTALPLINGWTNAPFSTSNAEVTKIDGVVYFKGAIASGGDAVAFVLPSEFRPATNVYIPVDLCNAHNGRLFIQPEETRPGGIVTVQAETAFSDAQCFTSLDGASFVQ